MGELRLGFHILGVLLALALLVAAGRSLAKRSLARVWLWRLTGLFRPEVTIDTAQGTLTVSTRDVVIGKVLYITRQWECAWSLASVRFLIDQGFLLPGRIRLCDIGANVGVIAIGLVRAGLVAGAVAIEPEARNFDLLTRNVRRNGLADRIVCRKLALGERAGRVELELSSNNYGDHRVRAGLPLVGELGLYGESSRQGVEVEMTTLDALADELGGAAGDRLYWLDVQGYEGHVIAGGNVLLAGGPPMVSEVWPYGILRAGMTLDDYAELVAAHWTRFWLLRQGRFEEHGVGDLAGFLRELGTGEAHENVLFTGGQAPRGAA